MHLLDSYALQAGAKIDRPFIYEKYIPVPFSKFISFHPISKDAKNYDFWQDVIDILYPIFQERGVQIVQIGSKEDKVFRGVYNTCGQTNLNQVAFIVKNAILHLSTDTFSAHIAGSYDKKIVALYSNNYVDCVKPFWGTPSNQILLAPNLNGNKPSFSLKESPKTINSIPIEKVAKSVCDLLEIPFFYPFKTIAVGTNYGPVSIEGVPNQVIDPKGFGVDSLIVRMDYEHNEQVLLQQAQVSKVSIITDKTINIDLLSAIKPNVLEIVYFLDEKHDSIWAKKVQNLGIRLVLMTTKSAEFLKSIKLDYMDLGLINIRTVRNEIEGEDSKSLFYKSRKFVLSAGKVFPSYAALLKDKSISSFEQNTNEVINIPEFWQESDAFQILKRA